MNINSLFVPLIFLASCTAILAISVLVLYCRVLKYIKKHSVTTKNIVGIPGDEFWETLEKENETPVPDTYIERSSVPEPINFPEETILPAEPEISDNKNILPLDTVNFFSLSTSQPTIEVDIIQTAKDAIESLTSFAEAQNIKIHLSTTCQELMVMAAKESIRILFRNIIDNSIKYMGRAGHMIITISLLGDDIFVILKDTGKGLNEEETTHIFELNFQGSNRVSGNGLGLTQSKMIVEAFGGTIYAKSSPENGMAIYIQLPVSKKHD